MGIYISGMEMPKNEPLLVKINPDGSVSTTAKNGYKKYDAVPVPAHGRLIDASEKIRVQIYDDMTEDYHMVEMTIDDLLCQGWVEANAPTIIPAEPGEEE